MRNTSVRPRQAAFRHPPDRVTRTRYASPYLPIDTPPRPTTLPPSALRGLIYEATLSGTAPVPRPSTPYQSKTFPLAMQSNAGPAAIGTREGIAINNYSPVGHFRAGQIMEQNGAVPITRAAFANSAKGFRRMRGRAIPFPFTQPQWLTPGGRLVT